MRYAWLALLLILAPAIHADEIDDYVKSEMQRQRIPGCAVAVIRNGKPVKMQGYGLANVELNVPVTPNTVFKLASVSKQFVASGVMLLVQDGKLSLEDTLAKHFQGGPEVWKTITIRHLLSHTGGLQRELPEWSFLKTYDEEQLLEMAKKAKSNFTPGERYEYCNTGYFLLGLIISKVSGMPWEDFIQKRIFEQAGMTSTRATSLLEVVPNRASGYEYEGAKMLNAGPLLSVRTSGAFLSTISDMAKWESALLAGSPLKQATLDQMWTPVALTNGRKSLYGFGWSLDAFRGRKMVQHDGALLGFRTSFMRFMDDKISIVVLCNAGTANASTIARGIALRMEPSLSFHKWKPMGQATPEQKGLVLATLKDMSDGKAPAAAVPALAKWLEGISASSRKTIADQLAAQGNLLLLREDDVAAQGIQEFDAPVARVLYFKLESKDKPMYYIFHMTPDSKVALIETARE